MAALTQPNESKMEITKRVLKDSSWITIGWDWFMMFLGRAAQPVLWFTMIFNCYQLIPGAPQPADGVISIVFLMQFIALDIGGIGLNTLAQEQGYETWEKPRLLAYALIAITLFTVGYGGMNHVLKINKETTYAIEVVLTIIRSIMVVLYGLTMHSLKEQAHNTREIISGLQSMVDDLTKDRDGLRATHTKLTEDYTQLKAKYEATVWERGGLRSEVDELRAREIGLLDELTGLRALVDELQGKLNKRIARATQRATGYAIVEEHSPEPKMIAQQSQATGYDDRATRSLEKRATGYGLRATDDQATGYVAADNGDTLAISNGEGLTMIATGSHRDRIKQAMLLAIQQGQELDYGDIAQIANVGYSTVKKYASEIKKELVQELASQEDETC